jgi:4-amino-4-deoxy-L-arabinose transferase-like glycosyltransferase
MTLPPSEWLVGGWDPGVYVHTAAGLARGGSLRLEHPDLAAMGADGRAVLGREFRGNWEPFAGMRMTPDGWISPQYYHAYPVLMAMVWPFGGAKAALLVNPLLNVLCIVAMYSLAASLIGRKWALVASVALALSPAQVWQARFATSEMLTQLLLLGGVALLVISIENSRIPEAVVGGAALGLALMTRYDAVMFAVPLFMVLLWGLRRPSVRRPVFAALTAAGLAGIHCFAHARFLAPFYRPAIGHLTSGLLFAAAASACILCAAMLLSRRPGAAGPGLFDEGDSRWSRVLRLAAAGVFACWFVFSWYVRPRLAVEGRVLALCVSIFPGIRDARWFAELAGRDAGNILYLASLAGRAGLVVASAGIVYLIMKVRALSAVAWLSASCAVLAMLMMRIYHEPFMMFASRRLVPVVVPLLAVGTAAACAAAESLLLRARPGLARAAWLLFPVAVCAVLPSTAAMARNREWPGLGAWLDALVARVPADARVVSDQPGFAAPLRFIYGLEAYEVSDIRRVRKSSPEAGGSDAGAVLARALEKAGGDGPLFLLTTSEPPPEVAARSRLEATLPLESQIQASARHSVPAGVRPRGGLFRLYRVGQPRIEPR